MIGEIETVIKYLVVILSIVLTSCTENNYYILSPEEEEIIRIEVKDFNSQVNQSSNH